HEFGGRVEKERSAVGFINGFNVTFDDAVYRTAQLNYDLGFDGAPMMFSWPSQGAHGKYDGDEEAVQWSSAHLKSFLERVARESGVRRIHLIAHSMGNRALTNALKEVGTE